MLVAKQYQEAMRVPGLTTEHNFAKEISAKVLKVLEICLSDNRGVDMLLYLP